MIFNWPEIKFPNVPELQPGNVTRPKPPTTISKSRSKSLDVYNLQQSKKTAIKRDVLSRRHGHTPFFVGNLRTGTTASEVEAVFRKWGHIKHVEIHLSQGSVTPSRNVPDSKENLPFFRDVVHALIWFDDPNAGRQAVAHGEHLLGGDRLMLSTSPADLPECKNLLEYGRRKAQGSDPLFVRSRPVHWEKTVIIHEDQQQGLRDRNQFMGVSFSKCIA